MDYNIIGFHKKEYRNEEYGSKYYVHTAEYPHVINVPLSIFNDCQNKSVVTFPLLTVSVYEGKYYYKYTRKE